MTTGDPVLCDFADVSDLAFFPERFPIAHAGAMLIRSWVAIPFL
jgi:hypothetical protein